jgi:hypothetical protein
MCRSLEETGGLDWWWWWWWWLLFISVETCVLSWCLHTMMDDFSSILNNTYSCIFKHTLLSGTLHLTRCRCMWHTGLQTPQKEVCKASRSNPNKSVTVFVFPFLWPVWWWHVWSKHVADLWIKYIVVFRLDLFCTCDYQNRVYSCLLQGYGEKFEGAFEDLGVEFRIIEWILTLYRRSVSVLYKDSLRTAL